jgi:hypothetical protein
MRPPWASADKQPEAETAPERRVTVILDERASQIADVLQDALSAGFHVVAFPPADDVIAVLTAASPRLVDAHRQLHPTVGLVITGRAPSPTRWPRSSTPAPTTACGKPTRASWRPGSKPLADAAP